MGKNLETLANEARALSNELFKNDSLACREQKATECRSCMGYGHIDELTSKPSIDKRNRHCLDCTGTGKVYPPSCIQKEEDRPLTKAEKTNGWARRPFFAYDPARMCNACLSYYYAERAAQMLHQMHCLDERAKAIAKSEKASAKVLAWTVWTRADEDARMERQDSYDSEEVACEFAEELVRQGAWEAVVNEDIAGKQVFKVGR